jgi:lysophospholipase L1-like esterase
MKKIVYLLTCFVVLYFNCSSERIIEEVQEDPIEKIEALDTHNESENPDEGNDNVDETENLSTYKILALGDSYTIGQSVCETCRFPEQLKDSLQNYFGEDYTFGLQIIAQTGWTTTNLKNNINLRNPDANKDLVTLLIGVNNQYQGKAFSLYEQEFPELVQTAKRLAKGNKNRVMVISIPDYAYTPFGQNSNDSSKISAELDTYNTFAKNYCAINNISFINITDITRMGLDNTNLVAKDGLHPSELAYSKFVERVLPIVIENLKN